MIKVNIEKAKEIAHNVRRANRAEKMKPLDIEATVPYLSVEAEQKRSIVREQNAQIQFEIESAETVDDLKASILKL